MIVGVVGFIGSGKGTVGEILVELGFHQLSFASAVKDVASSMFGWPRYLLEGDTEESRSFREKPDTFWSDSLEREFTPRLALQLLGTEVGRNVFHENFWIIKMRHNVISMRKSGIENFVVTDVRFPNEIAYIQQEGGILIEVQRGAQPHWFDIAMKANKGDMKAEKFLRDNNIHESEWKWIGSQRDHCIVNNGTIDNLKEKVIKCLTPYYGYNIMKEMKEGVLT
jgi:hypothetical protein